MGDAAVVMARFLNLHCLETSLMEGAFQFEEKVDDIPLITLIYY